MLTPTNKLFFDVTGAQPTFAEMQSSLSFFGGASDVAFSISSALVASAIHHHSDCGSLNDNAEKLLAMLKLPKRE